MYFICFSQEKQEAIDKGKPKDINLSLPGWGDWGGHNIKPNKRKQKRFMVKMPEAPPRRDENKGNLIINENEDSAVRTHQVRFWLCGVLKKYVTSFINFIYYCNFFFLF